MSSDALQIKGASASFRVDADGRDIQERYKRTEVGLIPAEWKVSELGAICSFENGDRGTNYPSPGSFVSDGVPFINAGHLAGGRIELRDMDYITQAAFNRLGGGKVRPGDILFCLRGTLGKFGVVATGFGEGAIASSLVIVRPRSRDLFREFLAYYFGSDLCSQMIEKWAGGAAQPNLGAQDLARFSIPIPPTPEQRAIAEALSDVDGLLGALEAVIAKKLAIKQAAMQQLLTGKIRLPGFEEGISPDAQSEVPGDWRLVPLAHVSSMHGRIGWQGLKQLEFTTRDADPFLITGVDFGRSDIDWGSAYHVSRERYDMAPQIQLRPHDVLMTKDGTIGKLLYVKEIPYPGMATLNSHLLVLRPISGAYVPRFLFYQLSSRRFVEHVEQQKSGSTFFGLSQEATGRFIVPLPSVEEQAAIASMLSDVDAEITALEARREKTSAIKQGMMQQLLTGRVRLVKPAEASA